MIKGLFISNSKLTRSHLQLEVTKTFNCQSRQTFIPAHFQLNTRSFSLVRESKIYTRTTTFNRSKRDKTMVKTVTFVDFLIQVYVGVVYPHPAGESLLIMSCFIYFFIYLSIKKSYIFFFLAF